MSRASTLLALFSCAAISGCATPNGDFSQMQADLAQAQADIAELKVQRETDLGTIAELASRLEAAEGMIDALNTNDTLQDDRLTDVEADYATSGDVADAVSALSGDVIHLLNTDTVYSVSSADELMAALKTLDGYRIASDVTVTIQLADDGDYTFDTPVRIRHPDGASIHIVGNTSAPASVVLDFPDATDGIVVENGDALGMIEGVTINGAYTSSAHTSGLLAKNGAAMVLGDGVVVSDFYFGVHAEETSTIEGAPSTWTIGWLSVSSCNYDIYVFGSSYAYLPYAYASAGGDGFRLGGNSAMDVSYASSEGGYSGFVVTGGSAMLADSAVSTEQADAGFVVGSGSYLEAKHALSNNSNYALDVEAYGYADFLDGTLEGTSAAVLQVTMGAGNVTGSFLSGGVSSNSNDIDDFLIGN